MNNSIARKDTPPAMSSIFMRVFLALLFQKLISYPIIINKSPFSKCYHHLLGIDKMLQLAIKTFIHNMLNGHNATTCDKRMSLERQYLSAPLFSPEILCDRVSGPPARLWTIVINK